MRVPFAEGCCTIAQLTHYPVGLLFTTYARIKYILLQVVEKNEAMLREHADVVTVQARFIAPLLALLARRAASDDEPA